MQTYIQYKTQSYVTQTRRAQTHLNTNINIETQIQTYVHTQTYIRDQKTNKQVNGLKYKEIFHTNNI